MGHLDIIGTTAAENIWAAGYPEFNQDKKIVHAQNKKTAGTSAKKITP